MSTEAGTVQVDHVFENTPFFDNIDRRKKSLNRDYGLIEISFERDSIRDWVCRNASVNIHRLAHKAEVPAPIQDLYRQFPDTISVDDLRILSIAEQV